jgi:predicted amidohydrolase
VRKIISMSVILLILLLKLSAAQQTEPFKVAAVEFNPLFMQLDVNINNLQKTAAEVAQQGAKLIVFPEMASCGYIYKDRAQVEPFLDTSTL